MHISSMIAELETVEAPPVDAPAADIAATPEVAPAAPVEPAADTSGPQLSEDDLATLRELGEIAPILRQAFTNPPEQTQVEQPQEQPEWDPYDPESTQRFLEHRDQQLLGEIRNLIAPLVGDHETRVIGEAEERAHDILTDLATRNGEFDSGEEGMKLARQIADTFMPDTMARYGPGPRAAEAALDQAYKHVKAIEQAVGQKAVDRFKNELGTLGGARIEPGSTGVGGVTVTPRVAGDETDFARHYAARG